MNFAHHTSCLLTDSQEEMELANELGADRDGLEEHLSAIDSIQARKIELISKLNKVSQSVLRLMPTE